VWGPEGLVGGFSVLPKPLEGVALTATSGSVEKGPGGCASPTAVYRAAGTGDGLIQRRVPAPSGLVGPQPVTLAARAGVITPDRQRDYQELLREMDGAVPRVFFVDPLMNPGDEGRRWKACARSGTIEGAHMNWGMPRNCSR